MAKLFFYYGALGSSKTANALMAAYNYERVGKKPLMLKPAIDTRNGDHIIWSRIGLQHECYTLEEGMCFPQSKIAQFDCVIVDEVQFATKDQIDFLAQIVDDFNIPVMCYGLRTDSRTDLFEGAARLFAIADVIEEIKTVCWCGAKAICNARFVDDKIIYNGAKVDLGTEDKYVALCRKHYRTGKIKNN